VATGAKKVGELVAEIAAASQEQAEGIGQVNKAVEEVDRITQQNAGNAEESASASAQMSAQAERMKGFVEELVALVKGRENGEDLSSARGLGDPEAHGCQNVAPLRPPGDGCGKVPEAPPNKEKRMENSVEGSKNLGASGDSSRESRFQGALIVEQGKVDSHPAL
jgi:methyl-accepting chemotaxis protein